jgi:hypothetical protein
MSSHSRSNLSPHQREEFLRAHGYEPVRSGKGSHEVWEHTALKEFGKRRSVKMPDNLKSTPHQRGWELILSCDPGPGLWHRLEKQCTWANETADRIQKMEDARTLSRRLKFEFNKAVRDVRGWQRCMKAAYKAGVSFDLLPSAPLDALKKVHKREYDDLGLT